MEREAKYRGARHVTDEVILEGVPWHQPPRQHHVEELNQSGIPDSKNREQNNQAVLSCKALE